MIRELTAILIAYMLSGLMLAPLLVIVRAMPHFRTPSVATTASMVGWGAVALVILAIGAGLFGA